ncbi:F-box domain-containing protein [Purpureocillium lavendulum]|uniref:F-box domain-containing protein n=1 Tax=Purpureocillium lavendulum TaxID=1247861 RepID=A0AB34FW92_9HYPO|nr:F-box domain-containing protein [Purpureocillium lavendulum]
MARSVSAARRRLLDFFFLYLFFVFFALYSRPVAASALAIGDPAGAKNVGNGAGGQFITGACVSDNDCASKCCANQNNQGGVCSGVGAQFQAGKTGCGFSDPNAQQTIAAAKKQAGQSGQPAQQQPQQGSQNNQNQQNQQAPASGGRVIGDPAGAKNVGNGAGGQFITGACVSDNDCASKCCANQNNQGGVCSGVGAQFQAGKTGCGFNDPNAQQTIAANKSKAGQQGFRRLVRPAVEPEDEE